MDWQQITALSIVCVTAGLFVWSKLRSRKRGLPLRYCCSPSQQRPAGSIIYHSKTGERPKIIFKP